MAHLVEALGARVLCLSRAPDGDEIPEQSFQDTHVPLTAWSSSLTVGLGHPRLEYLAALCLSHPTRGPSLGTYSHFECCSSGRTL